MDTREKLDLLARDAQYDLSCACGTKNNTDHRKRSKNGSWLYPVTVPGGGTGIMLKTLMTNACSNDCKYCPLRSNQDHKRMAVTPDKLARFFMDIKDKQGLIGLFLSSGVLDTPDRTMERLIDTAEILRKSYQYRGYIHIKIIPGASYTAIERAIALSSAVSLNIETPGVRHYSKLSDMKDYMRDIINPLKYMSSLTTKGAAYQKVGKTTQFIVGASDETDQEIITYLWGLYKRLEMNRIYFSAYQKGLGEKSIPGEAIITQEPTAHLIREHRLYQADFLVRTYGFSLEDFSYEQGALSLDKDPKQVWADNHPEFFPVRLRSADRHELLRVPGLGPALVNRILTARKQSSLRSLDDIKIPRHLASKASSYVISD